MTKATTPLAVIDLGSNTARLVVFRFSPHRTIEVQADERIPLRLLREVEDGLLDSAIQRRLIRILRDFRQVALGMGAQRILAVGTSALREATNAPEWIRRARAETGVEVRLVDGRAEGRCAFLGAVYGLPAQRGLVVDIGGGSMQLTQFRDRRSVFTWSLPLGALRLSDLFLDSDPPAAREVRELRAQVQEALRLARVPALRRGEVLIGTGGTLRTLAKFDSRTRGYPVPRLHGYEIGRGRLADVAATLCAVKAKTRAALPGVNGDRAASIAGGSVTAEVVLRHTRASGILVAGLGLREGVVLRALGLRLPAAARVRRRSLEALTGRFASWEPRRARRRVALARTLHRLLEPGAPGSRLGLLEHAAFVLDIGRSVDYYRRHAHTALILRSTDLMGFLHREILQICAMVEFADGDGWNSREYRPLLQQEDEVPLRRSGVVLALADLLEHRLPPGERPRVAVQLEAETVRLREPRLAAWDGREFAVRFRRAFGRALVIADA